MSRSGTTMTTPSTNRSNASLISSVWSSGISGNDTVVSGDKERLAANITKRMMQTPPLQQRTVSPSSRYVNMTPASRRLASNSVVRRLSYVYDSSDSDSEESPSPSPSLKKKCKGSKKKNCKKPCKWVKGSATRKGHCRSPAKKRRSKRLSKRSSSRSSSKKKKRTSKKKKRTSKCNRKSKKKSCKRSKNCSWVKRSANRRAYCRKKSKGRSRGSKNTKRSPKKRRSSRRSR